MDLKLGARVFTAFLISILVSAQSLDLSGVSLKNITYASNHCNQVIPENFQTLANNRSFLTFDPFFVHAGPGVPLNETYSICQFELNIDYPAGLQYALETTTFSGRADFDEGMSGYIKVAYYFRGVSQSQTSQINFKGPRHHDFYEKQWGIDGYSLFSPCGSPLPLVVSAQIRFVYASNKTASASIQTDRGYAITLAWMSYGRDSGVVAPYSDISGIGVIIGFVTTAYIAVLIMIGYFLLAFQPELDPFRKDGAKGPQVITTKPNPIDKLLLGFIKRSFRRNIASEETYKWTRLEHSFNKCVLSMSDLQIISGIAILISGYASLHCGLSAYHWQIIVYLAWFSSITHLSALTFLRNYLYNRPGERLWRLVSMFFFLIMLSVAIVPTGNFNWLYNSDLNNSTIRDSINSLTSTPSSYATCYFGVQTNTRSTSYSSMVVSVLLLLVSFVTRVIKLHKSLSVLVVGRTRIFLSKHAGLFLKKLHTWSSRSGRPHCWKRTVCYLPLLAIFLVFRLWLDVYSSMASEVYWLVISILWGTLHLFQTRDSAGGGDNDWTFGQILPVLFLVAPLIAISEYLYPDNNDDNHITTASSQIPNLQTVPPPGEVVHVQEPPNDNMIEDVKKNYYQETSWFLGVLALAFCLILFLTVYVLILVGIGTNVIVTITGLIAWILVVPGFLLSFCILMALNFEKRIQRLSRLSTYVVQVTAILLCCVFASGGIWYDGGKVVPDFTPGRSVGVGTINVILIVGNSLVYVIICLIVDWIKH